eukprot:scaffold9927_cov59-Phaeocystis_antarctica.AAC.4
MVVTFEKTKLSGWLNADASCRVERRAHDAGLGAGQEAGGRGVAAAQAARTQTVLLTAGGQGAR